MELQFFGVLIAVFIFVLIGMSIQREINGKIDDK